MMLNCVCVKMTRPPRHGLRPSEHRHVVYPDVERPFCVRTECGRYHLGEVERHLYHKGPELYVVVGNCGGEALTGGDVGQVLSRENMLVRGADTVDGSGRPSRADRYRNEARSTATSGGEQPVDEQSTTPRKYRLSWAALFLCQNFPTISKRSFEM